MADRVNQSNNSPAQQMPSARESAPQPPPESPTVDRAAAEFASLLGADEKQADTKNRFSQESAGSQAFEAEQRSPQQRVEERGRDGQGEREQSGDGEKGSDDGSEKQQAEKPMPLGDAILKTFARAGEAAPAQGPQAARDTTLDGIVQQIAEKIMVSEPTSGQREVRIVLKQSILPGTEVRISQQAGKLQIQLVTDSQKSLNTLNQNQASLQQRLTEKLDKHEVVVQVEMEGQGQPDPDGRSRQRREITEEEDA